MPSGCAQGRCPENRGSDVGQVFVVILSILASRHRSSARSHFILSIWQHLRGKNEAESTWKNQGEVFFPRCDCFSSPRVYKAFPFGPVCQWPSPAVRGRKSVTRLMLYDSLSHSCRMIIFSFLSHARSGSAGSQLTVVRGITFWGGW